MGSYPCKNRQLNEDAGWVAHTHQVMDTLAEVNSHLREAEAFQRTYLIIGGDTIPPDVAANVAAARRKLETVKELTRDNAGAGRRASPTSSSGSTNWRRSGAQDDGVRQKQGFDAARHIVAAGQSRRMQ